MFELSKIKQRKNYLESEFQTPKDNLFILEKSAKQGNISSLEKYISEWDSYNIDEYISLNHCLTIMEDFLKVNNKDYIKNKITFITENNIIPKIKDKYLIQMINEFTIRNELPNFRLLKKCNEMITYDRIIKNQNIIEKQLNLDEFDDMEDMVLNICELYQNNKILTKNEKYALSLENSLYTFNNKKNYYYVFEEEDDIIDTVNTYFEMIYHESFDYNTINPISEAINTFSGIIIGGSIGGVYLNNGLSIDKMLSSMPKGKLKKFERENSLRPLDEIDYETSRMISSLTMNDYSDSIRTQLVRKTIDGRDYNCIAFYESNGLSKLSVLYKKNGDLVAVPVYSKISECQPTIITNGIHKNLYETADDILYINEKKKIDLKKSAKKTGESLKSALSKIDFSNSNAAKIKRVIEHFFTKKDTDITDDLPGVFKCIRTACLVVALSINPYLGILTYITNKFIEMHLERKQKDKVIAKYEAEIKTVEKKLEKVKNDKSKEKYEKYLKELKSNKQKLEEYYDKYFTDDEKYGSDDDDFNFDESTDLTIVNEMNLVNTLKLAQQKFKKAILKMSDKEKKLSNQMDSAYDRFVYTIEKNMSNKNREAVIKGSVIPSFSALMKLALTAGIASFISPLLSAITVLGGLAASKKATANERKYILDEIEIQLKVVEKKLQLAESNNDMKSYEQLLKIQRQLESEKNRIIYRKRRPVVATKYN